MVGYERGSTARTAGSDASLRAGRLVAGRRIRRWPVPTACVRGAGLHALWPRLLLRVRTTGAPARSAGVPPPGSRRATGSRRWRFETDNAFRPGVAARASMSGAALAATEADGCGRETHTLSPWAAWPSTSVRVPGGVARHGRCGVERRRALRSARLVRGQIMLASRRPSHRHLALRCAHALRRVRRSAARRGRRGSGDGCGLVTLILCSLAGADS